MAKYFSVGRTGELTFMPMLKARFEGKPERFPSENKKLSVEVAARNAADCLAYDTFYNNADEPIITLVVDSRNCVSAFYKTLWAISHAHHSGRSRRVLDLTLVSHSVGWDLYQDENITVSSADTIPRAMDNVIGGKESLDQVHADLMGTVMPNAGHFFYMLLNSMTANGGTFLFTFLNGRHYCTEQSVKESSVPIDPVVMNFFNEHGYFVTGDNGADNKKRHLQYVIKLIRHVAKCAEFKATIFWKDKVSSGTSDMHSLVLRCTPLKGDAGQFMSKTFSSAEVISKFWREKVDPAILKAHDGALLKLYLQPLVEKMEGENHSPSDQDQLNRLKSHIFKYLPAPKPPSKVVVARKVSVGPAHDYFLNSGKTRHLAGQLCGVYISLQKRKVPITFSAIPPNANVYPCLFCERLAQNAQNDQVEKVVNEADNDELVFMTEDDDIVVTPQVSITNKRSRLIESRDHEDDEDVIFQNFLNKLKTRESKKKKHKGLLSHDAVKNAVSQNLLADGTVDVTSLVGYLRGILSTKE